jgi:hypothetical protein
MSRQQINLAFGPDRSWTVLVPDNIGESKRYTTRLIQDRNPAHLAKYDHLFLFYL